MTLLQRRDRLSPRAASCASPDAQAAAVLLYERGLSLRTITDALGISCWAVRDRLDAAERRIVAYEPQEVTP